MNIRVGFGYDVHQLVEGEDLIIGGIKIPHQKGTLGHSDADVLIHAIIDSILGAANLRDIGYLFPDNSSEFKNIDSKILLQKAYSKVQEKGFVIGNIDSTIALQKPKIKEYIDAMKSAIAETLKIDIEQISIKASTTEKLGFEGREEGVSAYAVTLLTKENLKTML
jgi:2-C-methyl-D-erythritol 2,4-cyclodiphosphate synthase